MIYRGYSITKHGEVYQITSHEHGVQAPLSHALAKDEEEAMAWIDVEKERKKGGGL